MSLFAMWPAVAAALIAAVIPREAKVKHRVGYGAVAFVMIAAAIWLLSTPSTSLTTGREDEWPQLLNILIGLPVAGAIGLLFIPRQMLSIVRGFTYGIFALSFIASLWLLKVPMTAGWHFQYIAEWIPSVGVRYHVAVDGISVWLVILTTFTTPIAAFASFGSIDSRVKELCIAFLILQAAMIGAFVALDLFLFYLFWELMLVPMFLLIGIWGGANKIYAAVKFFLFTMAGSVLMLGAMLYVVWTHHELTGVWSFDLLALSQVSLPGLPGEFFSPQSLCYWAFSIAFFIKVPMFPVHTWLPDAHTEAPTGGSVVLAAIMLKLGTYAYMRFSMGLFPGQARTLAATLAGVAIMGGIIYGALCAWKQSDVKKLVAYSSVAHLGFVMLGLFGAHPTGLQGAILQMVNHGIATGALFLLVGVIKDRRHTSEVAEFGGLAKIMPVYATLFVIVTMASVGVPGTNGFIGEFMIIVSTYLSPTLAKFGSIQTIGAALGVILAAIYMLSVVQKTFFGPLTNPKNKHLNDITPREGLAVAPLIIMIFVIGWFPSIFIERMEPAVASFHRQFHEIATTELGKPLVYAAVKRGPALFDPEYLKGAPELTPAAPKEPRERAMAPKPQPSLAARQGGSR